MLRLNNASYHYPKQSADVIHNMDLEFKPGRVYGLLGANGTGKSTILYLLSGLLRPQHGRAELNGLDTFARHPSTLSDLFIVPEEFALPSVTLQEYVRLTAPFYPRFSEPQLMSLLSHFRLTPDIHLGRLSMGQRKKAFISFALACNTAVLLMDEPTNGLDIPGKSEFRRAVVECMNESRTIVISTHQVRDLDRILDHMVMIDRNGPLLNTSIEDVQKRLQFIFTPERSDLNDAIWSEPAPGGFNIIRFRKEGMEETDVNLESLFQCVYNNPSVLNQTI